MGDLKTPKNHSEINWPLVSGVTMMGISQFGPKIVQKIAPKVAYKIQQCNSRAFWASRDYYVTYLNLK